MGERKQPRKAGDDLLLSAVGDGWVARLDLRMTVAGVFEMNEPGEAHRRAWRHRKNDSDVRHRDPIVTGSTHMANVVISNATRDGAWIRSQDGSTFRHRDWQPHEVVQEESGTDMTREEAREVTASILRSEQDALDGVQSAWRGRAWVALGYGSWEEYLSGEGVRMRLSSAERRKAVSRLRAAGLSTRAIGSAIGVSHQTVARDIDSTGPNVTVEQPATNVGLDGRRRTNTSKPTDGTRPAKRPNKRGDLAKSNDPGEWWAALKGKDTELLAELDRRIQARLHDAPQSLRVVGS